MLTEIAPHRLRHGDALDGLDDLMAGERADIVYADPPWGQGNLKFWHTMNAKQTGLDRVAPPHETFLTGLLDVITRHAAGWVLIEYGVRWRTELITRARGAGLQHIETIPTQYRSGRTFRPLDLHVFHHTVQPLPDGYGANVKDRHGLNAVLHAVQPLAVPNGVLLDPCCGVGLMAEAAARNGMRFRGNEMNAKRLDDTAGRLRRIEAIYADLP